MIRYPVSTSNSRVTAEDLAVRRARDDLLKERVDRLAELLVASPGAAEHKDCGVRARPCSDCRRTAPLECVDVLECGITDLCRVCAATWRMRLWSKHPVRVRRWLSVCARFVQLGRLRLTAKEGSDLLWIFRRVARRDFRKILRRELKALAERGATA